MTVATAPSTPRQARRRVTALVGLAIGAMALATPMTAVAGAATSASRAGGAGTAAAYPRHLSLPDGFQPEGIATTGTTAYLGSRVDGDIYRLDLATGRGRVVSQGPGTPSMGLKVDPRGRLFVAGGSGGDARVIDARTGRVLRSYQLVSPAKAPFINDVVLTRTDAWFTDSMHANLYRIPLRDKHGDGYLQGGPLPTQADVQRIRLKGDWVQTPDELNANGITAAPRGRSVVVDNSADGTLYRVRPGGLARTIDLGGTPVTDADGMLLRGRTLYVVQNQLDKIAVVTLSPKADRGRIKQRIGSKDFDVPSTVAFSRGRLYLPNARFSTTPTPRTPYWVTAVRAR